MSFDLYVWREAQPMTAEQAERVYHQLAEGRTGIAEPDDRVQAFHQELTTRFPDLEDLSEEEIEASPWSMSPELTPTCVITTIMWPRAQELTAFMIDLAGRHGLICYDPQERHVHNPTEIVVDEDLHLQFCDGSTVNSPNSEDLRQLLQRISPQNWYAYLERQPGWFVQVGIGQNAGNVPPGQFAIEYREGENGHYRTLVTSLDDVATLFEGFAADDQTWKTAFPWTRYG
jgi:hypothetical protein